jgi:preprotein translocase subunit YajC
MKKFNSFLMMTVIAATGFMPLLQAEAREKPSAITYDEANDYADYKSGEMILTPSGKIYKIKTVYRNGKIQVFTPPIGTRILGKKDLPVNRETQCLDSGICKGAQVLTGGGDVVKITHIFENGTVQVRGSMMRNWLIKDQDFSALNKSPTEVKKGQQVVTDNGKVGRVKRVFDNGMVQITRGFGKQVLPASQLSPAIGSEPIQLANVNPASINPAPVMPNPVADPAPAVVASPAVATAPVKLFMQVDDGAFVEVRKAEPVSASAATME